jgi:hypothetical protein
MLNYCRTPFIDNLSVPAMMWAELSCLQICIDPQNRTDSLKRDHYSIIWTPWTSL